MKGSIPSLHFWKKVIFDYFRVERQKFERSKNWVPIFLICIFFSWIFQKFWNEKRFLVQDFFLSLEMELTWNSLPCRICSCTIFRIAFHILSKVSAPLKMKFNNAITDNFLPRIQQPSSDPHFGMLRQGHRVDATHQFNKSLITSTKFIQMQLYTRLICKVALFTNKK